MLFLIIGQLLDLLIYGIFAKVLYSKDITKNRMVYIVYTAIVIAVYIIGYNYLIEYWVEVGMITVILFLLVISNARWLKKIWIMFSTITLITLIQQFVFLFLGYDVLLLENPTLGLSNIIMGIFVLLISGFIYVIKMKMDLKLSFENTPFYLYANIILGISTSFFPLLIAFGVEDKISSELKVIIAMVSYLALACTAITVILFVKNRNEKKKYFNETLIQEKLLQSQKSHYEDMVKNYEAIRIFKHDINGHLRVLLGLEQTKQYDKFHEYTLELQDFIKAHNSFQCNNVYIAAIINSFNEECKAGKIEFSVEYSVKGSINMSSIDICSLLHNLISNAVEETKKVLRIDKKVTLKIINIDTALLIDISNPLSSDFDQSNMELGKTTKSDKDEHGIGSKSIHQMIDMYDGDLKYYINNNTIKISIVLIDILNIEGEGWVT